MKVEIPAKYRGAFYAVAMVVSVGLIILGIVTPEQVDQGVAVAGRVIAVLASILALLNLTPDSEQPVQ